jgi:hypothetical protein
MLTFFQVNCDAADCVDFCLDSGLDSGFDAGLNVDHVVCVDNSVNNNWFDDDSVYDDWFDDDWFDDDSVDDDSVNNDWVYDLVNDASVYDGFDRAAKF